MFRTLTPRKGYSIVVCLIGIVVSVESLRHAIEGGCKHGFVCHAALTSGRWFSRTDLVQKCFIIRGHIYTVVHVVPETRYSICE